jgi:hypothetical protein
MKLKAQYHTTLSLFPVMVHTFLTVEWRSHYSLSCKCLDHLQNCKALLRQMAIQKTDMPSFPPEDFLLQLQFLWEDAGCWKMLKSSKWFMNA